MGHRRSAIVICLVMFLGASEAWAAEGPAPAPKVSILGDSKAILAPPFDFRNAAFTWFWAALGRVPVAVLGTGVIVANYSAARNGGPYVIPLVAATVFFSGLLASTGVGIASGLLGGSGVKTDVFPAIGWSWILQTVLGALFVVGGFVSQPLLYGAAAAVLVLGPAIDVWMVHWIKP